MLKVYRQMDRPTDGGQTTCDQKNRVGFTTQMTKEHKINDAWVTPCKKHSQTTHILTCTEVQKKRTLTVYLTKQHFFFNI